MAGPYCSSCGAPLHPDAKFCSSCGHATTDARATPAEQREPKPPLYTPKPDTALAAGGTGHRWLWTVMAVIGAIFVIGAVANSFSDGGSGSAGGSASSSPPPGSFATEAEFTVSGVAPNGLEITYGTDTSNYRGGPLPFYKVVTLNEDAGYYDLNAQLHGGGSITCTLSIGDAVVTGHAAGGYNICSAQLNRDPINGGWLH
jgi:zinc-ribbon domain